MFNLFQQKADPSIICALRDGAALPHFLRHRGWKFDSKVEAIKGALNDFDANAAEAVIDQTGFYIFTRNGGSAGQTAQFYNENDHALNNQGSCHLSRVRFRF